MKCYTCIVIYNTIKHEKVNHNETVLVIREAGRDGRRDGRRVWGYGGEGGVCLRNLRRKLCRKVNIIYCNKKKKEKKS